MTQEEKQILLKDLCARLPYGVKCLVNFDDGTSDIMTLQTGLPNSYGKWNFCNKNCSAYSDNFKPYLRPMSSMTEEEKKEFINLTDCDSITEAGFGYNEGGTLEDYISTIPFTLVALVLDWLNVHQFDYRNLIAKGLALEAPEDMYKNI